MLSFSDDSRMIADILKRDWPEEPGVDPPVINYIRESYAVDARVGTIFVEATSVPEHPADSDYRTVGRTGRVSITISCRFRETMLEWSEKVCDILYGVRRAGWKELAPYTFLEIANRRVLNNMSGWNLSVIEIRLTGYHVPVESDGLGQCGYKCTEV